MHVSRGLFVIVGLISLQHFFASAEHKQRGVACVSPFSLDNYPTYSIQLLGVLCISVLADAYREMTNQGQIVDHLILGERFDLSNCHQVGFQR